MSRPTTLALLALPLCLAALPGPARAQEVPLPPPPPPLDTGYATMPAPLAPAPQPEEAPEPEKRTGFSLKIALGGTYRNLYGIHFGGGDLALSLGGQTKGAAFYADLSAFVGSTISGLTTSDLMIGFRAEGRILSRLRIGGGATISLLVIKRITSDSSIFDFTLGPALHVSFDVVQFEDSALYVIAKGGFGWLVLSNSHNSGLPLMGNGTVGMGFRY